MENPKGDNKLLNKTFYEIFMSLLALTTVGITLGDLAGNVPLNSKLLIVDSFILSIFALDYGIRLYKSNDKKVYFKKNIWDLIAIIPFSSFFRLFRVVRLLRFLRLMKLFKMAIFLKRFRKSVSSFMYTNGFIYIAYTTVFFILLGSIGIYFVERGITISNYPDAIWWAFVTATTVGYGDISPVTGVGRIIASVLMLIGIGFIGMLTGTIATYFLSPKKESTFNESKLLDLSILSDEEFNAVKLYADYLVEKSKSS